MNARRFFTHCHAERDDRPSRIAANNQRSIFAGWPGLFTARRAIPERDGVMTPFAGVTPETSCPASTAQGDSRWHSEGRRRHAERVGSWR